MATVFRISLIGVTLLISLDSLCWSAQLEKGTLLTNSPNESTYSLLILNQEKESTFSLLEKTGGEKAFYGPNLLNSIKDKEISIDLQLGNTMKSSPPPNIQENDLIYFEGGQLPNNKFRYHFQEIHLKFDPSLKIISSLLIRQYKEVDPLYSELERFKETDILKFFTILLGLKLKF